MSTARTHALQAGHLLDLAREIRVALEEPDRPEDERDELADQLDLAIQLAAAHALTASALAHTKGAE